MMGSFITRGITMMLGYVYPAYECFKIVERSRPNVEILRFWCQYWMILALITVAERIGDTFVSWVPLYSEAKLMFIIYLWYPRTKGTTYIYQTFLRPFVVNHEPEIDRQLNELRTRSLDLLVSYWQTSSSLFQAKFFEILQYLAAQSSTNRPPQGATTHHIRQPQPPPPPPTLETFHAQSPPPPPPPPPAARGYEPSAPPAFYPAPPPPSHHLQPLPPPPPPPPPPPSSSSVAPPAPAYRPGFYPSPMAFQPPLTPAPSPSLPLPRPQSLRNAMREEIDLVNDGDDDDDDDIDFVDVIPSSEAAASGSNRYMTRSRQRASTGKKNW